MTHKTKWFTIQQPSASTVRHTVLLLDRLLAPYYPSVCMSVFISACWHVAQSVNTDRRRDGAKTHTHTHTCIPARSTHAYTNARSPMSVYARARAYPGCVVHNLCAVTWISLASVKAAVRAHASTEHAAGKPSSQCARQKTGDASLSISPKKG